MDKTHSDLKGQRFGSLLITEFSHKKPSKDSRIGEHFMWKSLCDCGREKLISGTSLFKGVRCICARYKKVKGIPRRDVIGKKFGEWEIMRFIKFKRQPSSKAIYLCRCSCGTEKELYIGPLINEESSSCGCKKSELMVNAMQIRFPKEERELKCIFSKYKSANTRQKYRHEFHLSYEYASKLFLQNCHYCDRPPSNIMKTKHGMLYYSGIDRVDNTKEYVEGNVVSCCIKCNRAKHAMKIEDFVEMIKSIYNHFVIKTDAKNNHQS